MPFAISSLFLPKYCGILLFLGAWTREMLIINVIWFHVRQNCQKLLKSFIIFSFICLKLRKTFCIFTSRTVKVLQLIGNHACSMISFILLKSIFLVMFEIYSLSEQDAGTLSAHIRNKWVKVKMLLILISRK